MVDEPLVTITVKVTGGDAVIDDLRQQAREGIVSELKARYEPIFAQIAVDTSGQPVDVIRETIRREFAERDVTFSEDELTSCANDMVNGEPIEISVTLPPGL